MLPFFEDPEEEDEDEEDDEEDPEGSDLLLDNALLFCADDIPCLSSFHIGIDCAAEVVILAECDKNETTNRGSVGGQDGRSCSQLEI